jgi:hypothetical protein
MNETSIQTRPNPAPVLADAAPQPCTTRFLYVRKVLKALASLRLTVFLFALSMVLVFCGTLAMMDHGLWATLTQYFRAFIAWIPLQVFVRLGQVFIGLPPSWNVPGSFPFPGGWSLGAALLVNLLAAHITRFRFTWKRAGILILHSGLILLMLSELVTGLFAVEGIMTIPLGGSSNYVENFDRLELAFVWPADAHHDHVVVVPDDLLRQGGTIHHAELPVDIDVVRYVGNCTLTEDPPPPTENLATRGFGLETGVVEQPLGRGVDPNQKRDMPAAYLALKDKKTGQALGVYLVSPWFSVPQKVEIGGTTYQLALRFRRSYRPFTFHLKELRYENYHGTNLAKEYASLIRVIDPEHGEDREVLIHMNHPFYYQGETFYQANVNATKAGEFTGLQAVRNPGWLLPYIACTMVSGGMALHFLILLRDFLRRKVMP